MSRHFAVASAVVLLGAVAGCSSGSDSGQESAAPVESAAPADRAGAQEANASDCTQQSKSKQQACMRVTANVSQFDSSGGLEPVTWDYANTTAGCKNTHQSYWHTSPAPPASFTTDAYFEYYTTHISDDVCPNVNYKAKGGQLPSDIQQMTFYAINQNTGDNSAKCTPSNQSYLYCPAKDSGNGDAEDYSYTMRNYPVTVVIQNSLPEELTLQNKSLSAMKLDAVNGTPGDTIAKSESATWGAYRQHSTGSTIDLKYKVGGSQDYSGTVLDLQVQVDNNGSPTGSKCPVANKSSFDTVNCDVQVSPVVPTPTNADGTPGTVSPQDQPPVTIAVQVHR